MLPRHRGLLPADLPVINIALDPLGPDLTHPIYDPRTEYGIDPYTHTLVVDERSRQIFLDRGYDPNQVLITDTSYCRSELEKAVSQAKLADLDHFALHGPTPERPLQIAIVHDNFGTHFENAISQRLVGDYLPEILEGRIFPYLTLNLENMEQLIQMIRKKTPENRKSFAIIDSAEELEELMQNPGMRKRYLGALITKPPAEPSMSDHARFIEQQRLLSLYAHLNISRPSEHPRTAARYNTPVFQSVAYATQEVYMSRLYEQAGFAGDWTQLSRSSFSRYRAGRHNLRHLDLVDPSSYVKIREMAIATEGTHMQNGVAGVLAQIAQIPAGTRS
ncbi:MAG: hypothetical protein ACE5DX_05295 [Candidatus Dojkabacteria bacterium]